MTRRVLVIAAGLAVAGCGANHVATPGQSVMASADAAYIAAVQIGEQRVVAGKLSEADFHRFENLAYSALLLIRATSNTADLIAAQGQLTAAAKSLKGDQ
jgi:hypothetical protein